MEHQELKIRKWKVWCACGAGLYFVYLFAKTHYKVFTINFFAPEKSFLMVNQIVSDYPRFRLTGSLFRLFFIPHPYATLFIFWCIFLSLLSIFFYFMRLACKGYVARMRFDGLLLANNRLIRWHEIEKIESFEGVRRIDEKMVVVLKKAPTKNIILKFFKKRSNEKVVLDNFAMPLQDAYSLIVSYWERYR